MVSVRGGGGDATRVGLGPWTFEEVDFVTPAEGEVACDELSLTGAAEELTGERRSIDPDLGPIPITAEADGAIEATQSGSVPVEVLLLQTRGDRARIAIEGGGLALIGWIDGAHLLPPEEEELGPQDMPERTAPREGACIARAPLELLAHRTFEAGARMGLRSLTPIDGPTTHIGSVLAGARFDVLGERGDWVAIAPPEGSGVEVGDEVEWWIVRGEVSWSCQP